MAGLPVARSLRGCCWAVLAHKARDRCWHCNWCSGWVRQQRKGGQRRGVITVGFPANAGGAKRAQGTWYRHLKCCSASRHKWQGPAPGSASCAQRCLRRPARQKWLNRRVRNEAALRMAMEKRLVSAPPARQRQLLPGPQSVQGGELNNSSSSRPATPRDR